jgi:hypothetical protein
MGSGESEEECRGQPFRADWIRLNTFLRLARITAAHYDFYDAVYLVFPDQALGIEHRSKRKKIGPKADSNKYF